MKPKIISECKEASQFEYTENNALLKALDSSLAIIEFDLSSHIIAVNQNYLDYFGYQRDEVIGQHHLMFCRPGYSTSEEYLTLKQCLLAGGSVEGRFERLHKDGSTVWLAAIYQPVPGPDGAVTHMVKIAKDITFLIEQQKATQEWVQLLTQLTDRSDSAMFIAAHGEHGQQAVYINQGFTKLFGYTPEQALGQNMVDLLQSDHPEQLALMDTTSPESRQQLLPKELFYSKDRQPHWCSAMINSLVDGHDKPSYSIGVLTDITLTKMYEVLQYKVLEALVKERPLEEVMSLLCHEVERIAPEVTASILQASGGHYLHHLAGPNLPLIYTAALSCIPIGPFAGSCGTAAFRKEPVEVRDIATDMLWDNYRHLILPHGLLACWSTPILSSQGGILGTFAFYYKEVRGPSEFHLQLVTLIANLCALAMEREQSRQQIQHLAFYDSLTGLPNRTQFLVYAKQAITLAAEVGHMLAVLVINLDRFKQVNDSFGHAAGDELLALIAQRLRDEMPKNDIIGRLSGDEFIIILTPCTLQQATVKVEKMLSLLSQPCQIANTTIIPSASVGISLYPENGLEMDTLMNHADIAMHKAKHMGHGHFNFFSLEMNHLNRQRQDMEDALRHAFHTGSLELFYQPQVMLKDGHLYGVEALSRWRHPILGNIPPQRFIPIAEECGLINELALWAIETACRQLADWRLREIDIPSVSVNLSPTNFHNPGLPDMILHTLQYYHLPPQDLTLEITEDILIENNPVIFVAIEKIHRLGVRLSMDDFGTGYSSLSYLRRLDLDEIKLDKSFVHDLEYDETSRTLSEAVIRIGESLQLTVIVEGVENEAQRTLLSRQGYQIGQGLLFSEALPAIKLEQWLEHRTTR
ncbi:sensor domain-containing protein [Yersinia pekkanenii]|uniref:Phosphodiesterase n=1 Tax=Yersinia pekkanenii TaxID=1288385 RepID=A0A0T9NGG3_9GAMM|nr:EAL domain-containing protein [Yersinia pekkanenii]CNH07301.1 putative phosphodiesterase [Yersinia pekkanenii]CRY64575.1 putative phosphodiesterase [Yersinia pekkanenii]